ncbi:MAG: hypothetical protein ACR2RE_10680 [Geminicoccaceae bacterium]
MAKLPNAEGFVARSKKLLDVADSKVKWQRDKPHCVGIWFGAKWQKAGYYHVQRYRFDYQNSDLMEAYNDDYWFGPLTEEQAKEEWTHFIRCSDSLTQPSDQVSEG